MTATEDANKALVIEPPKDSPGVEGLAHRMNRAAGV